MSEINQYVVNICNNAKNASSQIAKANLADKNKVLLEVIKLINSKKNEILLSNKIDFENAINANIDPAKIDRLILNEDKIKSLIISLEEIIKLPDPVGRIIENYNRPNDLNIQKISTPIGVLLAIYEARPNVTCDVSALALKSGNAVILRSGSDCLNTSKIIADIFREALVITNFNSNIVSFIENKEYEVVNKLLKMNNFIDVVIPRGGKKLIKAIIDNSNIPMFNHLDGNCHTYVHQDADLDKALKITINAKMRRTSICGATETLLVDQAIATKFIPLIAKELKNLGCQIRADEFACKIDKSFVKATEDDYYTEFLDKIIAIKIVENVDQAIAHIAKYGSSHTESIITENNTIAEKFLQDVNSAIVMHNTSTQFADGYEFGMGAEVGIATGKLHARGPIGLVQLTTFKYQVRSKYAIRNG
ncbi:gamma-glutamyl phosphate reductase [Alphaproteobacteria bacterium]|nr:gamma-glutamyl phosphate reductase [Alphaproteobacteria bacterium]